MNKDERKEILHIFEDYGVPLAEGRVHAGLYDALYYSSDEGFTLGFGVRRPLSITLPNNIYTPTLKIEKFTVLKFRGLGEHNDLLAHLKLRYGDSIRIE